jgi:ribosomal protein L11 methyltransferase
VSVDSRKIKDLVRCAVTESTVKLTSGAVEAYVKKRLPLRGRDIRKAIKSLVSDGELIYTYTYGSSFLERSFGRPIRITDRVVLMPPNISFSVKDGDIPIIIEPGVSFGMGDHPTTRLALAGLESEIHMRQGRGQRAQTALDIGTGSGVLAIASVKLGVERAVGIDTDPSARWEAENNIEINGVADRIDIRNESLENLNGPFDLVLANLRLPTLKSLSSAIKQLTVPSASVILSGIKTEEIHRLLGRYEKEGFQMTWMAEENGWAGVVLTDPSSQNC